MIFEKLVVKNLNVLKLDILRILPKILRLFYSLVDFCLSWAFSS